MATKQNLTLRIDPDIRDQASQLFQSLGLDMSTATGIFFRQCIQENGIPFPVKMKEPNNVTYQAMEDAANDDELFGPFDSVEELMEALNA